MSKIVTKMLGQAMRFQERRLAVTANNLANASTPGYKSIQPSFEMPEPAPAEAHTDGLAPPLGSYLNMSDGGLVETGGPLDMAIEGSGFFVIQTPNGTFYTRNGSFFVDERKRLVTSTGGLVMGRQGEIVVEGTPVAIQADGTVYAGRSAVGSLKVVDFNEKKLLQPVGYGLFQYAGEDGGVVPSQQYSVRQGFLETSNVDVMKEMTTLIDTQRSFEAYDKVKKMAGDASKALIDIIAK